MSEQNKNNTKYKMEKGQLNLDEESYDEYLLKSDGNLSEENPMNETKANACDQKIAIRPFILTTRRNYDISSDVSGNGQIKVFEPHELDEGKVPEEIENNYNNVFGDCYNKENVTAEHKHDADVVSGDNNNATAVEEDEQDAGVVSGDNDNATDAAEDEQDAGVVSGDNDNATAVEEDEQDAGVVSGDNDNATAVEEDEQDAGVVSGDNDNATAVEEDEQDAGVVSGDNDNATAVEEHEDDDGVVSGDDGNDKFAEGNEHHDCVLYGDDDNDTVVEEHDSVNTHFVTDEEDIAFSIKNLFSCIGGKEKKKDKNPYKKLTNDKEKQPLIEPFRQTQSKLLKMTHEHGIISSRPPIKTLTRYEVHNSDISGASFDTLVQSEQTNPGNIHTGNVHVENSCRKGHLVNNWDVAHNCIDPDQYDFTHPHRGYAVLIVNQHFSRLPARNGANVDVQNTTMVLQKLGFFIKNKHLVDLDKQSALAVLRDAKDVDHSRMDSFALIISSHGNEIENPRNGKKEHAIYCSDDQYIFTNDILKMFSDENCPSLKGKPKLFFLQACRGTKTDSGIEITVDGRKLIQEHSEVNHTGHSLQQHGMNCDRVLIEPVKNTESDPLLRSKDDTDVILFGDILDDTPIVHCNNDCLIMYAVPSGYFAWRSNVDGSWMLHYLWNEIKNYNLRTPCSFLKVLTAVTRKMAIRETNVPGNNVMSGKMAIPVIIHQLDKDIVFQEKTKKYIGYVKAKVI